MSTWISRSALALAVMSLAGCLQAGFGPTPPSRLAVANGAVVVAGPSGYCIDRSGSRERGNSAFVLLASCAMIARRPDIPAPFYPALLSATVAEQPLGSGPIARRSAALDAYFRSEAGRAALARNGDPASIEIVQTLSRDGVYVVHARDRGLDDSPTLAEDHWRAIFDVQGRIVSASVMALSGEPISDDTGLATVLSFAQRIKNESVSADVPG